MRRRTKIPPMMSDAEVRFFESFLLKSKTYFEYGCGGSTILASSFVNIESLTSVDSSAEWIASVKRLVGKDRVSFVYIDINAGSGPLGFPADRGKIGEWDRYPEAILKDDRTFDLIFVDGRFRVACCAASAMRMSKESVLLLHDCYRYDSVPLIKTDQIDSLGVYRKGDLSDSDLYRIAKANRLALL